MNTETLLPIPLLPHEAAHVAAHESGLLWRAIEPQPKRGNHIQLMLSCDGPRVDRDGLFAEYSRNITVMRNIQAPYRPNALYYVQEQYADILDEDRPDGTPNVVYAAHPFNSSAGNVGIDRDGCPRSIVEWRTTPMPPEFARTIIEITKVEVKQAGRLNFDESDFMGGPQLDHQAWFVREYKLDPSQWVSTWGFLYHYTVKERR